MSTREVQGRSSGLPTMLKAALPVLPGVNLLPGVAKKGGPLPDLTLQRSDLAIDAEHVRAYADVCGFAHREHLPLTYPHMLAFPLHMGIMTDASFPYAAVGSVHLSNSITQHRLILPSERLTVSATAQDLRPHPKGTAFDLLTTVTSEGLVVWESVSTYLRPGRPPKSTDGTAEQTPDQTSTTGPVKKSGLEVIAGKGIEWRLPADLGRKYAAVSGDANPIHLYPVTAKAFGFPRQIAHGMWTKARCVAAVDNRLADHTTVEVEFKKPVFLPGRVAFGARIDDARAGHVSFSLTNPKNGAPHVVGRAR